MTAAEQGRGKNLRNATKENARSAELRRVGRRNAHLALLMSRASAPKEMPAIIGILLSADSLSQGTAQLARNAASYIHLEKEVQQLPHQSRKAAKKQIKKGRQRKHKKKEGEAKPQGKLFLRIPSPSNTCFTTIKTKKVRFTKFSQKRSLTDEKLPT